MLLRQVFLLRGWFGFSCPDAIYVSIQFQRVREEKYEGRSLQSPEGEI